MAIEQPGFSIGWATAAADYSTTGQFLIVGVTSASATTVTKASSSGQLALGILQNKPKADEAADVMISGVSKVVIGTGDLVAGALFMAHTDGTAVTATGTGKYSLGTVLVGGAAGILATVLLGGAGAGQLN
jgi:hypothetical protein